jgi:hypothetical protein
MTLAALIDYINATQACHIMTLEDPIEFVHENKLALINQREIVLLTNLLAFGTTTIAAIYKDRWEIELFFKALKQNLKLKSFVGTSENALRIQIWTALIAILLLKWLHHLSKAKWSLSNLASMLRLNLFTYRDLRNWLNDPFETPPLIPESQQLTLALA